MSFIALLARDDKLRNVKVSVTKGGDCLLGQDFLRLFGSCRLDNRRDTLVLE